MLDFSVQGGSLLMFLLLILAIGFYLYKTGDLQKLTSNRQNQYRHDLSAARRVIDVRYASGKISAEEYMNLKNIL